jgi:nucleotidyltransferase/DNA polymerase involved in DNA repair
VAKFPTQPESLADPKVALLRLASKAPSKIRKALLPIPGSTAKIGIEYNDILCPLVASEWKIDEASRRAPSLTKARTQVHDLALKFEPRHHP